MERVPLSTLSCQETILVLPMLLLRLHLFKEGPLFALNSVLHTFNLQLLFEGERILTCLMVDDVSVKCLEQRCTLLRVVLFDEASSIRQKQIKCLQVSMGH